MDICLLGEPEAQKNFLTQLKRCLTANQIAFAPEGIKLKVGENEKAIYIYPLTDYSVNTKFADVNVIIYLPSHYLPVNKALLKVLDVLPSFNQKKERILVETYFAQETNEQNNTPFNFLKEILADTALKSLFANPSQSLTPLSAAPARTEVKMPFLLRSQAGKSHPLLFTPKLCSHNQKPNTQPLLTKTFF